MQLFWVNCEIVTFGSESVCPVQIRGHRMGGVSGLSVGKVVLASMVVLGYVGYCVCLVRVLRNGVTMVVEREEGTGMRMSLKRRTRFAERLGSGSARERREEVGVESVVIGMDVEKHAGHER